MELFVCYKILRGKPFIGKCEASERSSVSTKKNGSGKTSRL